MCLCVLNGVEWNVVLMYGQRLVVFNIILYNIFLLTQNRSGQDKPWIFSQTTKSSHLFFKKIVVQDHIIKLLKRESEFMNGLRCD